MAFVLRSVILLVLVAGVCLAEDEKYTTKFDNINLDDVLTSERLLNNYVHCLKGSGKCTPDGSELKRLLPDALENNCEKCSDTQREGAKKVVSHLVNKRPELWETLKEMYDPTGKYTKMYQEEYEELLKNPVV